MEFQQECSLDEGGIWNLFFWVGVDQVLCQKDLEELRFRTYVGWWIFMAPSKMLPPVCKKMLSLLWRRAVLQHWLILMTKISGWHNPCLTLYKWSHAKSLCVCVCVYSMSIFPCQFVSFLFCAIHPGCCTQVRFVVCQNSKLFAFLVCCSKTLPFPTRSCSRFLRSVCVYRAKLEV